MEVKLSGQISGNSLKHEVLVRDPVLRRPWVFSRVKSWLSQHWSVRHCLMSQIVFAFFCLFWCYGLNSGPISRCVHFPLSCTPASKRKDISSLDVRTRGLWSYLLQRASVVAIGADKSVSGEDGSPHGSRKLKGQDPKALGSRSWLQWPAILSTSLCLPKIPALLKEWRLVTKVSTPMGGIQDLSWC